MALNIETGYGRSVLSWLSPQAGEPSTPNKSSERPLHDDRPAQKDEKVEQSDRGENDRPRPVAPGGAGDVFRVE